MSQRYTTCPMRFSAHPAAMITFLEALGLFEEVDDGGSGAVFSGASGTLAVHATGTARSRATPGDTSLNFVTTDVDAAAADLRAAGLAPVVWDETYGRRGSVRSPMGHAVGVTQDSRAHLDAGFRVPDQTTAASLDVVAVWYSADFRRDAAFFARFGFEPYDDLDNPWWCSLRAGPGQGVIGLHRAESEPVPGLAAPDDTLGLPALVRLGFETSEPLDALAARLREAGSDSAAVLDDEIGLRVAVRDPDGQRIEIHPTT